MTLDYIFHGGDDLNDKMYRTDGFDDVCRKAFERWHLKDADNIRFDPEAGRFLEIPIKEANARLAIRTVWMKQAAGKRPECYFLGVKLSKANYKEAGDYYRLVSALRALSFDRIHEIASSGRPLVLALPMPMQRQSMWKPFSDLSGTRLIGAEKFNGNLEEVLLSVSVNNIDDWYDRMYLAIDPAHDCPEFNVVVAREKPKGSVGLGSASRVHKQISTPVCPSVSQASGTATRRVCVQFLGSGLFFIAGVCVGLKFNGRNPQVERVEDARKQGYGKGLVDGRKEGLAKLEQARKGSYDQGFEDGRKKGCNESLAADRKEPQKAKERPGERADAPGGNGSTNVVSVGKRVQIPDGARQMFESAVDVAKKGARIVQDGVKSTGTQE